MFTQPFRKTAIALGIFTSALFAAESPFEGTWKSNPSKSQLGNSGMSGNAVVRIESTAAGLTVSVQSTDAQGQPVRFSYDVPFDGKAATVSGAPNIDSISAHRVNANTITVTGSKAGQKVYTDRRVVSPDGKTMTITRDGTNPQGQPMHVVLVFDKE